MSAQKLKKIFLTVFVFTGFLFGGASPSHALLILDNMVFIGPKAGAAVFKIKNTGKDAEAYRLEWTQLRMNEKGGKEVISPGMIVPEVMPADSYMYVAPRRLMLMPDQVQHVRFMVRRSENLAPGEYRSYIVFQPEAIPSTFNPATPQNPGMAQGKAKAQMTMLTGYRIPVFFLHGDTSLNVSVQSPSLGVNPKGQRTLYFTFAREGTRSALGSVDVNCMVDDRPTTIATGEIRIFTELSSRNYAYLLKDMPAGCTTLNVDYTPHPMDPDYTGTPVRLAEVPVN